MPKNDSKSKQSYRTAWESLPDFKGWLRAVPENPTRAFCKICNKTLYAHRLGLLHHMSTRKHTKKAEIQFTQNEQNKSMEEAQCNSGIELMHPGFNTETTVINSSMEEAPNLCNDSLANSTQLESTVDKVTKSISLPPISTHVLDSSRGTPVPNLRVSLYKLINSGWTLIRECVTNPLGRCNEFISKEEFKPGRFKLHYDVDRYFELQKQDYFFPFVEIVFDVRSPLEHYHVPLILSPFGYSTYRGS
ncbi:probable 5-hydroxyisourate hydrolase R09H10.3 isoform X1 [Macrosteles quadrilineatus]|nr:probable 5-hydroxyisourate hydrolase R09H10.3 isoform X1 [Macrosteles quadrilineatus]